MNGLDGAYNHGASFSRRRDARTHAQSSPVFPVHHAHCIPFTVRHALFVIPLHHPLHRAPTKPPTHADSLADGVTERGRLSVVSRVFSQHVGVVTRVFDVSPRRARASSRLLRPFPAFSHASPSCIGYITQYKHIPSFFGCTRHFTPCSANVGGGRDDYKNDHKIVFGG
jgi:hypothetical protein